MVGGTIPPQSDSGEISRVLVLNLLWQSKRCSGYFCLDNAFALIEGHLGTSKIVSSKFLAAEAIRNDDGKGKLFGTLRLRSGQAQGLEVVPFPACSAPNFAGACGVARKCVGPSSGVLRERRTPLPPG